MTPPVHLRSADTQPERTGLSWLRSVASLAVVSLLFVRWADRAGAVVFLPCLLGLAVAAVLATRTYRRNPTRRLDFAAGRYRPERAGAALLCLSIVGLAALAAGFTVLAA